MSSVQSPQNIKYHFSFFYLSFTFLINGATMHIISRKGIWANRKLSTEYVDQQWEDVWHVTSKEKNHQI